MVIDTGIFIEHLSVKDKIKTTLYMLPDTAELYISAVSLYELYMGATNKEKEHDVRMITEDIPVLPFSDAVAFKAAQIYHFFVVSPDLQSWTKLSGICNPRYQYPECIAGSWITNPL